MSRKTTSTLVAIVLAVFISSSAIAATREGRDRDRTRDISVRERVVKVIRKVFGVRPTGDWPIPPVPAPKP